MRRPALVFALLLGLSLPFAGKPVHLDDANFLRLAAGARADPWRPHAISINWQGTTERAFDVLSNPPGIGWWLAPVADAPIWGMHLWMLLWLPLAVWGAWTLGARFAGRGAEAAVLLVGGPLGLLAAQSLMPDLPLLACTLAGLGGLTRERGPALARRWPWALLVGAAALFRYSGAALVPLVALWALLHRDRRAALTLTMGAAAPLTLLLLHDLHAYGQPHLVAMLGFQSAEGGGGRAAARKLVAAVAMLGGAGVLPLLGRLRSRAVGALVGVALGAVGAALSHQSGVPLAATLLAGAAGGATLGACAGALDRDRDPPALAAGRGGHHAPAGARPGRLRSGPRPRPGPAGRHGARRRRRRGGSDRRALGLPAPPRGRRLGAPRRRRAGAAGHPARRVGRLVAPDPRAGRLPHPAGPLHRPRAPGPAACAHRHGWRQRARLRGLGASAGRDLRAVVVRHRPARHRHPVARMRQVTLRP